MRRYCESTKRTRRRGITARHLADILCFLQPIRMGNISFGLIEDKDEVAMDGLSAAEYDSWRLATPEDDLPEYRGFMVLCPECYEYDIRDEMVMDIRGGRICRACASLMVKCVECDGFGRPEEMIPFEDEHYCPSCAKAMGIVNNAGQRID